MKWTLTDKKQPIDIDYPIVIVTKKQTKTRNKTRNSYTVKVVIDEAFLSLNIKKGHSFIKWLSLPEFIDKRDHYPR